MSNLSRNYQLGFNLGQGMNLVDAKNEVGQVAEGIQTLEATRNESKKLKIKMPLVESMYNILNGKALPLSLIEDLVNNPSEVDVEFRN
jgi:glycerol-3-phosphate dehydrogenase (NAD(P)+)